MIVHSVQVTYLNDGMYWDNVVMKTINWILMWERVVEYIGKTLSTFIFCLPICVDIACGYKKITFNFMLTLIETVIVALLCDAVARLIKCSKIFAKWLTVS